MWRLVGGTAFFASFKGDPKTAVVEIRTENATDPRDGRDQSSIVAIKEGSDGLTFVLSNPFHPLSAGNDGVVPSNGYGGSGTEIEVFRGGTQLTVTTGTPSTDSGTFKVTSTSAQNSRELLLVRSQTQTLHRSTQLFCRSCSNNRM